LWHVGTCWGGAGLGGAHGGDFGFQLADRDLEGAPFVDGGRKACLVDLGQTARLLLVQLELAAALAPCLLLRLPRGGARGAGASNAEGKWMSVRREEERGQARKTYGRTSVCLGHYMPLMTEHWCKAPSETVAST